MADAAVFSVFLVLTAISLLWDAVRSATWKRVSVRVIMYSVFLINCLRVLYRERTSDDVYSAREICVIYCARLRTLALSSLSTIAFFCLKYIVRSLVFPSQPALLYLPVLLHLTGTEDADSCQQFYTNVPMEWSPYATRPLATTTISSSAAAGLQAAAPQLGIELQRTATSPEGDVLSIMAMPRAVSVVIDAELEAAEAAGTGHFRLDLSDLLPRQALLPCFGGLRCDVFRTRLVAWSTVVILALAGAADRAGLTRSTPVGAVVIALTSFVFLLQLVQTDRIILSLLVRQFEVIFVVVSCGSYVALASAAKVIS